MLVGSPRTCHPISRSLLSEEMISSESEADASISRSLTFGIECFTWRAMARAKSPKISNSRIRRVCMRAIHFTYRYASLLTTSEVACDDHSRHVRGGSVFCFGEPSDFRVEMRGREQQKRASSTRVFAARAKVVTLAMRVVGLQSSRANCSFGRRLCQDKQRLNTCCCLDVNNALGSSQDSHNPKSSPDARAACVQHSWLVILALKART